MSAKPNIGQESLITSNDRVFACSSCSAAATTTPSDKSSNLSSSVTFDGEFLNTDLIQTNVTQVMAELKKNLTKYKDWLREKQSVFENYFSEYDATEELFNRLNSVIPQIKRGQKILNTWVLTVQDIVADIWDGIRAYADAKNSLVHHELQSDYTYSVGLPTNPVVLAKKNRANSKLLHKQRIKALRAESDINNALFSLESEILTFNQGIVRGSNGKFVNLVELGEVIDSLYEKDLPLERVHQKLANIINDSKVNVKLSTNTRTDTDRISDSTSFIDSLKPTDGPNEYEIIKNLQYVADNQLYTTATKPAIDSMIAFAESSVNAEVNKSKLADLTKEIRKNTPFVILQHLRTSMRDNAFENIAYLRRLLKNLHGDDRPIFGHVLEEVLDETYRNVSENIDEYFGENNDNLKKLVKEEISDSHHESMDE